MRKYIHYGSNKFDVDKFSDIKNSTCFCKPKGGLWASPIDTDRGWKDWCESENFRECNNDNSFLFTLKDNANVFVINSVEDCRLLPQLPNFNGSFVTDFRKTYPSLLPDFEKMVEDEYDAIEYNMSKDFGLYWILYGWDCDSILVLNKDAICVL